MHMERCGLALVLLAACTGADGRSGTHLTVPPVVYPPASDPAMRAARAEIEQDLAVVLSYTGAAEVEAGDEWPIVASVVNRSSVRARLLITPDDGSDVGWREPHVFYTVQAEETPGVFREVKELAERRSGSYASAWSKDAVALAPGSSMRLEWIANPGRAFDFLRSGKIHVVAHYKYEGGTKRSFEWSDAGAIEWQLPPEIRRLPPFELVSAPLELRVRAHPSPGR